MVGMDLVGAAEAIQDIRRLEEMYGGDDDVVWIVGTNVEYAAFVEFGTSKMEAQPYLLPAARRVGRSPGRYLDNPSSTSAFVRQLALAIEREAAERAPVDTGQLQASITAERVQ